MRQHRATHAITDRINTGHAGTAMIIDDDEAARIEIDACVFGQQSIGIRLAADGHHQLVELHLLFAGGIGIADRNALG